MMRSIRKVLAAIFAVCAIIAFILLLGTAGSLENNTLDTATGGKEMLKYTGVFVLFALAGYICSNKEDN